jgi:flagellar hook-length control protein FliK
MISDSVGTSATRHASSTRSEAAVSGPRTRQAGDPAGFAERVIDARRDAERQSARRASASVDTTAPSERDEAPASEAPRRAAEAATRDRPAREAEPDTAAGQATPPPAIPVPGTRALAAHAAGPDSDGLVTVQGAGTSATGVAAANDPTTDGSAANATGIDALAGAADAQNEGFGTLQANGPASRPGGPLAQPAGGALPAASPAALSGLAPAGAAPVAGPSDATTGPIHVGSIGTPITDPAFPGHLAADAVSLAITGIERAEISLRPRDMGPIKLELSLNGESARIAFAATQPETRQAIERSLPLLADMLASQGLLLADASVSDQGAGDGRQASDAPQGNQAPGPEGRAGTTAQDGSSSTGHGRRSVARGLLDLYA